MCARTFFFVCVRLLVLMHSDKALLYIDSNSLDLLFFSRSDYKILR